MNDDINIVDLWIEVDQFLKEKLGRVAYPTFKKTIKPISFFKNTLVVGVPNSFMQKWVSDKCDYLIRSFIKEHFNIEVLLEIKINEQLQDEMDEEINAQTNSLEVEKKIEIKTKTVTSIPANNTKLPTPQINQKYTFEKFVVGTCNRFAHAAAVAVAKSPGKSYNPLFIYGGVGLGKTHLMHAIGNSLINQHAGKRVLYKTAEEFTNELIESLQNGKIMSFRHNYRNVDILLIDDIPFIAGKEKTEEEFFHTFNYLYQLNKQIIITSDRLPKDIPSIGDRLKSRFEWGLSADLSLPDLETRIAILKNKTNVDYTVPKDVLFFIASQIPNNVRELEGALIKIIAYASLVHQEITINLAKDVIKDIVKDKNKKPISLLKIKKQVADYYEIDLGLLSAKIRTKEIAHARQVAMFLARELTDFSLPKIGENFGNRDHTTVMHACDKIREKSKKNQELRITLNQIKQNLN